MQLGKTMKAKYSYLFSYKVLNSYFKSFNYIVKQICAHNKKFKCLKMYEMKSL